MAEIFQHRVRIGSGAGYSGDRIEPAVDLAEKGNIQYLIFECLAERTIALAQRRKMANPELGYDPKLEERMRACLAVCRKNKVKIITNMGAANPLAAMHLTATIANELNLDSLKIAAITGDDVLGVIQSGSNLFLESPESTDTVRDRIISANAYLGTKPIVEALRAGADVVITGRVADPSLFVAPLIYEFNWSPEDFDLLGQGTVMGHLMECAGQITGGYFADPGYKDVPGLADLGFPVAEVSPNGHFFISKLQSAGGQVSEATCKEQLLYEIHNPATYFTPDVVADFTGVKIKEIEKDKVAVSGGRGIAKTGKLKVSVGYIGGFIGEGQISYGGSNAINRAKLALDIVKKRLTDTGVVLDESRYDLIGVNALYGDTISSGEPYEVRVRVVGKTSNKPDALKIGDEVETLYTNGPAGGGGVTKSVEEIVEIQSVLIDEALVDTKVFYKIVP